MGELAGQHHFPVVVAGGEGVEVGPVAGFGGARGGRFLELDGGLGGDFDFLVGAGNVEVMHDVAGEIAILRDIGGRIDVEVEAEAALVGFAARLHAYFHDALAHRGLVAEGGRVSDGIDQRCTFFYVFLND